MTLAFLPLLRRLSISGLNPSRYDIFLSNQPRDTAYIFILYDRAGNHGVKNCRHVLRKRPGTRRLTTALLFGIICGGSEVTLEFVGKSRGGVVLTNYLLA